MDALFGENVNTEFAPPLCQVKINLFLKFAVIPFAQIALQDVAVDIFAVGTVARPEIFLDGYQRLGRHVSIMALM